MKQQLFTPLVLLPIGLLAIGVVAGVLAGVVQNTGGRRDGEQPH
jgi:hypothetical protein